MGWGPGSGRILENLWCLIFDLCLFPPGSTGGAKLNNEIILKQRLCQTAGTVLSLCSVAAWCLRNEGVSSVLLGSSNPEQLIENLGAIQVSAGPGTTRAQGPPALRQG